MATYSSGLTISGGVNTSNSGAGGGPVTIYTVPSGLYFRGLMIPTSTGTSGFTIRINGINVSASWTDYFSSIWFPPGTVFSVFASGGGTVAATMIGATFKAIEP